MIGLLPELRSALEDQADSDRAGDMAAYMKDHFRFLGVASPERRRTSKPVIAAARAATPDELLAFAEACWAQVEREFQYVGTDALRAGAAKLRAGDLPRIRALIEAKSWWDTVDQLAAWVVGPLVSAHPELASEMDRWIDDPDIWVARTAILHQLGFADETDADRLFTYAGRRAEDTEFFIRKAIGWALRQYARVDPDAVRAFVADNDDRLSGLSKREALKHLERSSRR